MAGLELLTSEEMAQADRLAIAGGIPSIALMENAGQAVAGAAAGMVTPPARIRVLCGPGNNGGDGFVAARILRDRGYSVDVILLGKTDELTGDAAAMASRWAGPVGTPGASMGGAELIVDALFGAGLSRPLAGPAAQIVDRLNTEQLPIVSVDVPSGLDGSTGLAAGIAVRASRTVTFFRRKPGHLLFPGRELCGMVVLADIGIPDTVLSALKPKTWANAPALWRFPPERSDGHKYQRGHVLVISGPAEATGAARLAARGALRIGAGLVTVASPPDALAINASQLTAIMVRPFEVPHGLIAILQDTRKNAVLIGPGCGVGEATRHMVRHALQSRAGVVLDADAITSFAAEPEQLFSALSARNGRPVVLTPHEGEFQRLFATDDTERSKLARARRAAKRASAVIVLKGADTVVAAPDGRAAINENAPASLATAGSGDVLAGFVTGLIAQQMPAFEAACAAVWLHGDCAGRFGPGLIAEDLPNLLPQSLKALLEQGHDG